MRGGLMRLFHCLVLLCTAFCAAPVSAQPRNGAGPLPVSVSANGHYLVTSDGRPFFWLADTAWELVHSTTREEIQYYLQTRAQQGFTVIQAVALGEMDGLNKPTSDGLRPFANNDPSKPNAAYFDRVEFIVAEAEKRGLHVALLPSWGDKITAPWGTGPRIFTNDNLPMARGYGRFLASRLRPHRNVIWMLGGDRPARLRGMNNASATKAGFAPDTDWEPIWRAMVQGIKDGSAARPLIAYHPSGGEASTSVVLPDATWLDINGMQSGHGGGHDVPVWNWVARDFAVRPAKPTIDLEPNYEDHPVSPWPRWDASYGYFTDYDVRKQSYRSVFAGGAGVTYGHHSMWGFVGPRNDVINHAMMDWVTALQRPGARQVQFLKNLILSRPVLDRIEDPGLIASGQGEGGEHMVATGDGSYGFVYFPTNDHVASIDLSRIKAPIVRAWWFDPRTGVGTLLGDIEGGKRHEFKSPPQGPDWVLILDDAAKHYAPPGLNP
jgi:hypothetical protein